MLMNNFDLKILRILSQKVAQTIGANIWSLSH